MLTQAEKIEGALPVYRAVADAIKAMGAVPAGHLYAVLMGKLDLNTFNKIIGTLTGAGVVERKGDLLIWKGVENANQG